MRTKGETASLPSNQSHKNSWHTFAGCVDLTHRGLSFRKETTDFLVGFFRLLVVWEVHISPLPSQTTQWVHESLQLSFSWEGGSDPIWTPWFKCAIGFKHVSPFLTSTQINKEWSDVSLVLDLFSKKAKQTKSSSQIWLFTTWRFSPKQSGSQTQWRIFRGI